MPCHCTSGSFSAIDVVDSDSRVYFQVVSKAFGSNRPKLVNCPDEDHVICKNAPLALLCQFYRVWRSDSDGEQDVYPDGRPQWVYHSSLVPQGTKYESVLQYHSITSSDFKNCLEWSQPRPALPTMSPLDDKCPTLWIVRALLVDGWTFSHLLSLVISACSNFHHQ